MALWLLKTEPSDFSYDGLEKDGRAVWDGVANNTALMHMRRARKGDRALIYHTGDVKAAVGIATITSDPYPDPNEDDEKLVVFDLAPDRRLKKPVSLAQVKAEPKFKDFDLVRISRLSVMPVTDAQWALLLRLAGEKEKKG
jgi:predicted RNA-binding protein with PUA-like domain